MIEDSARRAAGPARRGAVSPDSGRGKEKRAAAKDSTLRPFKYGRFWDKSRMHCSEDEEDEDDDVDSMDFDLEAYTLYTS